MKKSRNYIRMIFLCLFIGVAVFFVVGEYLMPLPKTEENDFCQSLNTDWFQITDEGEKIPVQIPGKCEAKRNEMVTIETRLPSKIEGDCLCFHSSRQDMEIYIDGKLRKKYSTEGVRLFGKSSAAIYVFVDLVSSDAGKKLKVVSRTDSSYSGIFQQIYYGTEMGIWKYHFKENGAEIIIAFLMLLLAFVSIIGSFILRCCYHRHILLGELGLGVLCTAIWIICNSRFRQLLFPNVNVISDIPFFMIMLLPLPFLLYMDGIQKKRYHKVYFVLELLALADFVLFTVLHVGNIADFADTVMVTTGVCILSVLWIIFTLFLDIYYKKIKEYWLIAIGVAGTLLSGCAQICLYFQRTRNFNGSYVAVGLVFLLMIAGMNTIRDVLRMEKERQEAIYSSRSKAQFLANISHEIRTPINAVLGLDEMILQETSEDNIRDYAGDIQSAGRNLLALINDLLDFSKIESGKMHITPVEYSVFSMLSDCYHMILLRAQEKGLRLCIQNRGDIPAKLYGDEVRIRQILINLLTNAVKYTKRGSVTLTIEGKKTGEEEFWLILSVEDTGIGIKEENREALFESFRRLDEEENRNIEGTGLGLAITQQLVEIMGGNISVESVYGKGSLFRVELPQGIIDETPVGELSAQYMESYRESSSQEKKLRVCKGKILVVDDVSMNLKVFQGLLRGCGLEIDTAESGADCLDMVEKESYHLIFLDHMMPGKDGVETLHEMKKIFSRQNRYTPVIMLTANAVMGAKEEYLSQGFEDYLSKPVRRSDLEKMIRKYLPAECFEGDTISEKLEGKDSHDGEEGDELAGFRERFSFLQTDVGLEYCGESLEIYRGTIQAYLENNQWEKLQDYFAHQEWDNYQIQVHGLKSASLSIGATEMYQNCKIFEMAVKEGDIAYINTHHGRLMRMYKELLLRIKMALE